MFLTVQDNNTELTMTHEQIANLLRKRKDKVKQSMERLESKGIIKLTPVGEVNHLGQTVTMLHVNERDSYIVVAQMSPEFTAALVDEWKALKEEKQKGLLSLPDFTNPAEAARAWAEQYENNLRLVQEKETLLIENKEVKDYSERQGKYISALEDQHAKGITIPMFCKELNGVNVNQVQNFLSEEKNWMRKDKGGWVASGYTRDKYLSVKFVQGHDGVDRPTYYLTKKGAALIYKYYCRQELPMKKTWNGEITPQRYLPIIGVEE
ncbi:putative DNA-binding protein [Vibrio phage ICP1]|nr:putative DNA-binding protein [Vibrio phage ICP1]QVV97741.1 putative DNA-binding protein [Vibrio phage ICP1]QVV97968.1 putative DNA-binding protein [Vibrio phage ICP1]QVV98195.1 putative DNA-binding protein [Vibrio phage ICP1]QVV98421.1 putative DNA-binding protein [Vibrio phage ICP1]